MPPDAAPTAPDAPPSDAVLNAGDLRAAVGAGLVTEAQAVRLAALGQSRRGLRARVGDEPFELFRGLNDVFVAVGVAALGLGLWLLGLAFGDAGPGLLGMAGSWALAEYLTRIRRMTLPSLLLAIGFAASAAIAAAGFAPMVGHGALALQGGLASAAAGAAAIAFFLRFRLPFALFLAALAAYAALMSALIIDIDAVAIQVIEGGGIEALFDLGASSAFAIATLVFGLACFALALSFDLRDPHRVTRLSACGFWLHLAAGPAIVNTVALSLLRDPGPASGAAMGLFLAALAGLALALDRRSLLLAAAAYLASMVWGVAQAATLGPAGGLMLLGAAVVGLGAGWTGLRALLMRALPDFPGKDRLPPWTPNLPETPL
ncbi:hypothetical protein SAMN05444336_102690 [Albimonas donghaensis]|uniref:DUF2157 domain-containing protein n=1 Tax=Albimonas donghaensis TaxID=356660 RepID=A0A1H2XCV1_9RHOB|nr:hypothetical protein [Albimonas donghaensis]SDW90576.1 hypothetical protein SAMN05444336_102690 [Albimonas donghaensis]